MGVGTSLPRRMMAALSGEPSGLKAVLWMPCCRQYASSASLRQYGCASTCTTHQPAGSHVYYY